MYYLVSILFGLIPEVLYFTLFITYTKNIKEKRIKLFLLIALTYFVCILIQRFQIIFYVLWVFLTYLDCKLLYKKKIQIIDIFIISLSYFWVALLSFVLMKFVNQNYSNYYIIFIIQKILLFLPFVFKSNFNKMYNYYCKLWNRNDKEKKPIKSITLRNISLILLNVYIFFMNIILINIINFQK